MGFILAQIKLLRDVRCPDFKLQLKSSGLNKRLLFYPKLSCC